MRIWRSSARTSHFERLRLKMESRMLLAKPDFCFTIMDIGAKVGRAAGPAGCLVPVTMSPVCGGVKLFGCSPR